MDGVGKVGRVPTLEGSVRLLFALVSEAVARATWALLNGDLSLAEEVVRADQQIDDQTATLEAEIWAQIDADRPDSITLRELVSVLLILPELERSADLAEHIAQRARANLGTAMSPPSRGIVQRMSDVTIEMWGSVAGAFADRTSRDTELDEADEELDILRDRLTSEVAKGTMAPPIAAQVTLLARFYERLGDHAVNLSRRVAALPSPPASL
jgi:phosphate transport system protein